MVAMDGMGDGPAQPGRRDLLRLDRHLAGLATGAHGEAVEVADHAAAPRVAQAAGGEPDGHALDARLGVEIGALEKPTGAASVALAVDVERLLWPDAAPSKRVRQYRLYRVARRARCCRRRWRCRRRQHAHALLLR